VIFKDDPLVHIVEKNVRLCLFLDVDSLYFPYGVIQNAFGNKKFSKLGLQEEELLEHQKTNLDYASKNG